MGRFAPGADDDAIRALRVVGRCTCGCASVRFQSSEASFGVGEAETIDADGVPIWASFFTNRDQTVASMLEVLRADSDPITTLPDPATFTVTEHSHWGESGK